MILSRELEQIGVRFCRGAGVAQEIVDRPPQPRKRERLASDVRYAGEVGLRLRTTVSIQRQCRIVDAIELVRDVLRCQKHLGAPAVHRALMERKRDGHQRHQHDCLRDDPLSTPRHA